ncbi:Adenylyl-sulfate kinase [compost metagenome]
MTGLSGSGKSTLAFALEKILMESGKLAYTLDIRHGLCRDLGFSAEDRTENIRRIAEVAHLMNEAGLIVISSFISPYRKGREMARGIIGEERFVEVHVSTPLATCEQRDPKGLYRKARAGELAEFTGISAPYEEPMDATLRLDTSCLRLDECLPLLLDVLRIG